MSKFLVLRYGRIDDVDPIQEADAIVRKLGYVWYGKYGQPVAHLPDPKDLPEKRVFVVLKGPSSKGTPPNDAFVYQLTDWSRSQPPNTKSYPRYYRDHLEHIGTWFKLVEAARQTIPLDELRIKSSHQPLRRALMGSMRGHFWCLRSRNDQDLI
jgi:hypothetical protein